MLGEKTQEHSTTQTIDEDKIKEGQKRTLAEKKVNQNSRKKSPEAPLPPSSQMQGLEARKTWP